MSRTPFGLTFLIRSPAVRGFVPFQQHRLLLVRAAFPRRRRQHDQLSFDLHAAVHPVRQHETSVDQFNESAAIHLAVDALSQMVSLEFRADVTFCDVVFDGREGQRDAERGHSAGRPRGVGVTQTLDRRDDPLRRDGGVVDVPALNRG